MKSSQYECQNTPSQAEYAKKAGSLKPIINIGDLRQVLDQRHIQNESLRNLTMVCVERDL